MSASAALRPFIALCVAAFLASSDGAGGQAPDTAETAAASGEGGLQERESSLLFLSPTELRAAAPLFLILSGDGDWAAFDRRLSDELNRRGVPVIGLRSRTYLSRPRTPDETAEVLEDAIRRAFERWGERDITLVGYSRGAAMAPFVVNRWPDDLRRRVRALAFIGLGERASFEFHLSDLVHDTRRPTDFATRPEVARLVGIRMICVAGTNERDSFCDRPVAGMEVLRHRGGHRVGGDGEVVERLLRELSIGRPSLNEHSESPGGPRGACDVAEGRAEGATRHV